MRRLHCARLTFLAALLLVAAGDARSEDVKSAIEAGNRSFIKLFLAGDANGVAQLYTEDAQVIAPGAPVAHGRQAIAGAWKAAIDSGIKDLKLETLDVGSDGDLAYETGTVRLVAKDGTVIQDRYLVVWKRVAGSWKLHRDIWNSGPSGK